MTGPAGAPVVAVVDAYSTGRHLAAELARRGAACVHVRSQQDIPAYFTRSFAPDDFTEDLGHQPDRAKLTAVLRERGVRRVVAGTESGVLLADELTDLLGLPGNDPVNAVARRDKRAMADTVRRAGLAVPAGRAFDSAAGAAHWFAGTGFDEAVVKPVDSAGTDNVSFARSAAAVRSAAAAVLASDNVYGARNRSVLVQRRVTGREYYVNTVSYRGTHRVAEIWGYVKAVGPSGAPVYDYEEPVPPGSAEWRLLRGFTAGVLDALGVRSSAGHTEIMLTGDGPVLIESGARLGGATSPQTVREYCGVSQTGLFADSILTPRSLAGFDDAAVGWHGHLKNVAFRNHQHGTVRGTGWLDAVTALPSVVHVAPGIAVGDRLTPTVDLFSSPGYAYLASADPAQVARDHAALRRMEADGLYTR
ncbi:hypothetical protein POF50_024405 [Streptomyces sp. SL13]|uniref:ATP-grasp domain-containing protein n=1 Tax=Streptantibioticus silvisoli TaxID=2705255 RepID=A0AA90H7P5_9ACTN|nr:hypothetical protein [Streptantibioticus silvisoli]MDI5972443.1 hypothetical protein [Streptantibioticus silvisoli]